MRWIFKINRIPISCLKPGGCSQDKVVGSRVKNACHILGLLGVTLLAGCSTSHTPCGDALKAKRGSYKVGKPYRIKGVLYTPFETFDFEETGLASWYGPGFHMKTTANMEIFDQHKISAAHKTLQLPCMVEVKNLDNGRVLQMRVNDRGPFYAGRIIDLSRRAAELLGVLRPGKARVHIRVLKEESLRLKELASGRSPSSPMYSVEPQQLSNPIPFVPPHPHMGISPEPMEFPQCGNSCYVHFLEIASYGEAARLASAVEVWGPSHIVRDVSNAHYKVRVGPLPSQEATHRVYNKLRKKGFSKLTITDKHD